MYRHSRGHPISKYSFISHKYEWLSSLVVSKCELLEIRIGKWIVKGSLLVCHFCYPFLPLRGRTVRKRGRYPVPVLRKLFGDAHIRLSPSDRSRRRDALVDISDILYGGSQTTYFPDLFNLSTTSFAPSFEYNRWDKTRVKRNI